jgi:hypothetical protein
MSLVTYRTLGVIPCGENPADSLGGRRRYRTGNGRSKLLQRVGTPSDRSDAAIGRAILFINLHIVGEPDAFEGLVVSDSELILCSLMRLARGVFVAEDAAESLGI